MTERPLIVSLSFDEATFERLDALRRAHFPPERNVLAAHLTLFHHLPGEEVSRVIERIGEVANRSAFEITFARLRFLGRGVAIDVDSTELVDLRAKMAASFRGVLTRQDAQGFRPHVTIQNKVEPAVARALFEGMSADFTPWCGTACGLAVWTYLGGPWSPVAEIPFATGAQKNRNGS